MADDLQPVSDTFKRGFGFPDYLKMPGVKDDMKAVLTKIGWDLDESMKALNDKFPGTAAAATAAEKAAAQAGSCAESFKKVR
jgi:hypothetical protein